MALKEEVLDSFTGGMADYRASTDFKKNQWARLHGFVVEDGGRLRSQWAMQRLSGMTDLVELGLYDGYSDEYLVGVRASGEIVWTFRPDGDVAHDDAQMNPTWFTLTNADASTPTGQPYRRPIATVPLRQQSTTGFRSGLLLSSISMPDTASTVIVYQEDGSTTLRFIEMIDHWPADVDDDAIPKAEHGTLWNGVTVLGDVEWKDDPALTFSATNKKRHRNGLWLSEPGDPFSYDPLNFLFIGDAHSEITGLQPIDIGLLVFTTSVSSGQGGVYLLRGTPDDYIQDYVILGLGADRGVDVWQHTNTACWISSDGYIWQTDGNRPLRLDSQDLGVDLTTSATDGVMAFGPWLMATRDDRMFALRAVEDSGEGAWTELNIGTTSPNLRTGGTAGTDAWFLSNGEPWRFARGAVTERGAGTEGNRDLVVASRTLEGGGGHSKTFWRRSGVRCTAGEGASYAVIRSVRLVAGPANDPTAPSITHRNGQVLLDQGYPKRAHVVERGIGPSTECSIEATFGGDVVVEQMSVFYSGARQLVGNEEGH